MVTIKINEFEGYDYEELVSFLKESEDNMYEIIIPKETTLFFNSTNDIGWEFAIAAYMGEELNKICSSFSYKSAPFEIPDFFIFCITTVLINELANIILEASGAFGNSEIVEPIDFASEVISFLRYNEKKKVICQDIFDIAKEYYLEDDE